MGAWVPIAALKAALDLTEGVALEIPYIERQLPNEFGKLDDLINK